MPYRCIFWGLITIMILCACSADPASSGAKNTVQRMEMSELDAMISSTDHEFMIVPIVAWCKPCREELPILNKLYEKYGKKGLNMIGISLDLEGPEIMQPIVDKAGVKFPVYWVGEKAVDRYEIFALPMIFMVKEGKIAERIVGPRSREFLDQKIREFFYPGSQ